VLRVHRQRELGRRRRGAHGTSLHFHILFYSRRKASSLLGCSLELSELDNGQ
jgi:hypothetical protein